MIVAPLAMAGHMRGASRSCLPLISTWGCLLACALPLVSASSLSWDPTELPPRWWLPLSPPTKPATCGPRGWGNASLFLQIDGPAFSFPANALQTIQRGLMVALMDTPPRALLLVSEPGHRSFFSQVHQVMAAFDLIAATRSWACVVVCHDKPTARRLGGRDLRRMNAEAAFHLHVQLRPAPGAVSPPTLFHEAFMAQVLLRPRPALRRAVEQLEGALGLDAAADYVAVHLRGTAHQCHTRAGSGPALRRTLIPVRMPGGTAVQAADVCNMTANYLDATLGALRVAAPTAPVLVVRSDPDVPAALLDDLRGRYARVVVPEEHEAYAGIAHASGAHSDFLLMLLALRAPAFVGNPTSTFSANVAKARADLLREPRTNFLRDAVTIHAANRESVGNKEGLLLRHDES